MIGLPRDPNRIQQNADDIIWIPDLQGPINNNPVPPPV